MQTILYRMSVGTRKHVEFPDSDSAFDFLRRGLHGRRFGFATLVPQRMEEGDIFLFSWDLQIRGDAVVKRVIRKGSKIIDAEFGRFNEYKKPVKFAIWSNTKGYKFPTEPGQQHAYYPDEVLHEVRRLGK